VRPECGKLVFFTSSPSHHLPSYASPTETASLHARSYVLNIDAIDDEANRLAGRRSGRENVHHVHKVLSGLRYALTIAFTCDKSKELTGKWS
jgi:hypothetical protein